MIITIIVGILLVIFSVLASYFIPVWIQAKSFRLALYGLIITLAEYKVFRKLVFLNKRKELNNIALEYFDEIGNKELAGEAIMNLYFSEFDTRRYMFMRERTTYTFSRLLNEVIRELIALKSEHEKLSLLLLLTCSWEVDLDKIIKNLSDKFVCRTNVRAIIREKLKKN